MSLSSDVKNLLEVANSVSSLKKSNWFKFAKVFDIGVLDLDDLASKLKFNDFKHMDISINPKDLYKKDKKGFIKALKSSSLKAGGMEDKDIDKIMKTVSPN